jgi:L-ascorbate metabolism protein UlaG (beta-lactamase superfamily)
MLLIQKAKRGILHITLRGIFRGTLTVTLAMVLSSCSNKPMMDEDQVQKIEMSSQYSQGVFVNSDKDFDQGFAKIWAATKDFLFNKSDKAVPSMPIPIKPIAENAFDLTDKSALRFARLGHSSLMIQMDGKMWLTDPAFSQRTSPVQWAGPKRFHPVPLNIDELPEIEAVIISHNHYDHLDHGSIVKLMNKVNHFLVPLGNGQTLLDWGVPKEKITEFDWWDSIKIGAVELVATPAQHFSGRGLLDRNETLWASWVIRNKDHSIYFSGDTGYFSGFKEIGDKYGPFDYAFLECGAYNELWRDIHMMPEDTLQAFKDVKGKVLVPVHNGTFDLSTHAWFDPFLQIDKLAQANNIQLITPIMGEIIDKTDIIDNHDWWKIYLSDEAKISFKKELKEQGNETDIALESSL